MSFNYIKAFILFVLVVYRYLRMRYLERKITKPAFPF